MNRVSHLLDRIHHLGLMTRTRALTELAYHLGYPWDEFSIWVLDAAGCRKAEAWALAVIEG